MNKRFFVLLGEKGVFMHESLSLWIENISEWIEILAVALIVVSVLIGTLSYLVAALRQSYSAGDCYARFRHTLARALMLALELLVAADVVRTVAFEPSLQNVGILALLVAIRIVLGWSLVVEIEGRWPWQPERKSS
jgi:uncharacterized membrane protein